MKIDYKNKKLMSSEEMTQKEIEYKVESAKLQLQSDILATKVSKAEFEAKLEAAKHSYPLDTQTIIALQDEVEAYTEGLEKLEALMTELF
jgi:quercetin dioxygenase-like cupin family protein